MTRQVLIPSQIATDRGPPLYSGTELGDNWYDVLTKINAMTADLYAASGAELATTSTPGLVQPDGSTVTITGAGIISVPLAGAVPAIVGDGITDNLTAINNFNTNVAHTLTQSLPVACTISIANPAVITMANHQLLQGQALTFATTGGLPTGLTAGAVYYVIFAGLTKDTFRVSASNPLPGANAGDGPAVITSGIQSGAQSVILLGQEWTNLAMPPGAYHCSSDAAPAQQALAKRVRISAYGAVMDDYVFGGEHPLQVFGKIGTWQVPAALTQDYLAGSYGGAPVGSTGVFVSAGDLSKFYVGQWVMLCGGDIQGPNSFPPNNHFFEFHQIRAIDAANHILNFWTNIRNTYLTSWPDYGAIGGTGQHYAGPARVVPLNPTFDMALEVDGFHGAGYSFVVGVRFARFLNCVFEDGINTGSGQVFFPTMAKELIFEKCEFRRSIGSINVIPVNIEVDKLIEYLEYKNCYGFTAIEVQSSSVTQLVLDGCNFERGGLLGTARHTHVKDCNLSQLNVGTSGPGTSFSLTVENTVSNSFDPQSRIVAANETVSNFTFSNTANGGTLSFPLASGVVDWAVSGAKAFIQDVAGSFANMGSPFAVLGVRTDGTNTLIDTTLNAMPSSPVGALRFVRHPCPRVNVRNSSGAVNLVQHSKAPPDLPMFSYWQDMVGGQGLNAAFGTAICQAYVWGTIKFMRINVIRPYTGANNPMLMNLTANAFSSTLTASNMSMAVDLRTAGFREVTPSSATVLGADTLTAFANWISGRITRVYSTSTSENQSVLPLVEFEIQTDQGVTAYDVLIGSTFSVVDDLGPKSPSE